MGPASGVDLNDELARRNGDLLLLLLLGDDVDRLGAVPSAAVVEDSEGDLLNLARMDEGIERC